MKKHVSLGTQHKKNKFLIFLIGLTIIGIMMIISLIGRLMYINKKIEKYTISIEKEKMDNKNIQTELQKIEQELAHQESDVQQLEDEFSLYQSVVVPDSIKSN